MVMGAVHTRTNACRRAPGFHPGDVQRMINATHATSRLSIQAAGYAALSSILSALSSLS
jgi:hypothetical protein